MCSSLSAFTGAMVGAAFAVAAPVSVGHSGWTWGTPTPQGAELKNVVFVGARGYAVGEFGTVLRSDDGGHTWIGLPSGSPDHLSLVQEIDPNTVLVGGQCTVRESVNAGESFQRLPIDADEDYCPTGQIASFSFLNPTTGFVEKADGTILLTTNGGQTMEPKAPVPLDGATAAKLDFISPSTGFALTGGSGGGKIFRTRNGANTWTQVASSPAPLSDVTFVSPTVAYAVGANSTLLHSTNEGGTWEALPLALPAGTAPLSLTHISCSDVSHCLIATAPAPPESTNVLVRTTDGGMTGSLLPSPPGQNLLAVSFSTPSDAVAVGEGGATVLSSDGGASFPTVISSNLGDAIPAVIRIGQSPFDAYVPWAAGRIAATTDGGSSWSLLVLPTSEKLVDVGFPTTNIGYAVATDGTVFRTSNAGQNWSIVSSDGGLPTALLALNANTVLLVGPKGVRRSTHAGAHFKQIKARVEIGHRHRRARKVALANFDLSGGAQVAGRAIFVYGKDLLESTNGGQRWTLIPRPLPRYPVAAISFVSPTTGYETSDGRMFFTSNRGRSWREILSVGASNLDEPGQMSFSSALDGYVLVQTNGLGPNVVRRTEDGGRTWTPESLPEPLTTVQTAGAVDYAGGNYNDIRGGLFETTDGGLHVTPSTLTLSIEGPDLTVPNLEQAGSQVHLIGHLTPAVGGESVTIAYRTLGGPWQTTLSTVSPDGSFTATVSGIRATTDFVARWYGSGPVTGAGTPVTRFTVSR